MTFRSRPVLDRKHRPRWQDELRTQQLTILGFALAIALALGIFGAAAWNGYWETHFRPVAVVDGQSIDRGQLIERQRIFTAEAVATVTELQAQLGGPRDQLIQQQIDGISQQFSQLESLASQSLVESAVLSRRAADLAITVDDDEVTTAVAERMRLPERIRARLVLVEPAAPDDEAEEDEPGDDASDDGSGDGEGDADAGDDPTEEQLAAARAAAEEARQRVEDGEDFATVAGEVSDDPTATLGGMLGWFGEDDTAYDEYFDILADSEPGDLVGPIETDGGFAVLELIDRRDETDQSQLRDLLRQEGVSEEAYRSYVRDDLLFQAFEDHFVDEVVGETPEQRRVAQIVVNAVTGDPVPQERSRHVLIQPDPDAEDQSEASDEAWDAAHAEAEEVRDELSAEDADWFEIASEHSDDTGSGSRGGDLGWYDPEQSPFVDEFADALGELEVGEVSEPVRSEFGWHVIQKIGERESPREFAGELAGMLRDDPDAFAATARRLSEDHGTAREDGELGWVVAYQLETMHEDAIYALGEVGEVSDPVEDATGRVTIYQLLETSESREIEEESLAALRSDGFQRWLTEIRAGVDTWVDPQYATAPTGA